MNQKDISLAENNPDLLYCKSMKEKAGMEFFIRYNLNL